MNSPTFSVFARPAVSADLDRLVAMYGDLAAEQEAIREVWPFADGLESPVRATIRTLIDDDDRDVIVGGIDDSVLGFLVAHTEPLLAPMDDRSIGVIRLIYVDAEARGVGIGAAMLDVGTRRLSQRGVDLFDAPVSPGHRMAKNFFESNGFKARSIVMHRSGVPRSADGELDGEER